MKKLITLLLALAKVLRLTACGEQPAGATGDDGDTASVESDGRALYGRHTAGLRRRLPRQHRGPEKGCGRRGNRYLERDGH